MVPENHVLEDDVCFKKCRNCGFEWDSRDRFLSDKNIVVIGYQSNFEDLLLGLIYFNHSCGGTFAISANFFVDLYHGSVFEKSTTVSDNYPEYCLRKEEKKPCQTKCECSYIQEVTQIISRWPKA